MTTRILPQSEWAKLQETEAGAVWRLLDPLKTRIVVMEDQGVIVGCHVLTFVLHAECFWVHPAYRGAGIAQRLWKAVQAVAQTLGAKTIATAACDDRLGRVLERMHAVKLPGDHFVLAVKG
jgi:GNAT superfamily N-acetyltransferase